MKVAFYAPLKAPTAAKPSGDRLIGQLLIRALKDAGHDVELVSTFRSYDRQGDVQRQRRLKRLGERIAERLVQRLENNKPDIWFTYHLYHKAPDWIGPVVARAFDIPYVVTEVSFAPKQEHGSWAHGHAAVRQTLEKISLVIGLTETDRACVEPHLPAQARYLQLPPFLDTAPYVEAASNRSDHRHRLVYTEGLNPDVPWLLTVAMMRPGDKTESYEILAQALRRLGDREWQLLVVGDGMTRTQVESSFGAMAERVFWLGPQQPDALAEVYAASDIFVWPAVKETPGMCFLEAAAAGIPVVGSDGFGVPDVVVDETTGLLARHLSVADFADKVSRLLDSVSTRRQLGANAVVHVRKNHDIRVAGTMLNSALEELVS